MKLRLNTIQEIQDNPRFNIQETHVVGAIQNRYKKSTKIVNQKLQQALEGLSLIPRFFSPISDTTEIEKAQFAHQPLSLFNPKHKATQDFQQFSQELMQCLD